MKYRSYMVRVSPTQGEWLKSIELQACLPTQGEWIEIGLNLSLPTQGEWIEILWLLSQTSLLHRRWIEIASQESLHRESGLKSNLERCYYLHVHGGLSLHRESGLKYFFGL